MLFSIITICYNSQSTIERTLSSILSQNYKDYEYIVVDGASKDSTLQIVKRYESQFKGQLKLISEHDSGIYNAMNKGIGLATGDYIGIVNSDDWLESNALSLIAKEIEGSKQNADLICGSLRFHYADGTTQTMITDKSLFFKGIPHYSYNRGLFHPAVFVRRQVYDEVGKFDEQLRVMADVDFIFRCYESGRSFHFINGIISNMSDGGVSNIVHVRSALVENKKFLSKRNLPLMKMYFLLFKRFLSLSTKKFVPMSGLRAYRRLFSKNQKS